MHRSLAWTAVLFPVAISLGCSDGGGGDCANDGGGAGGCGELRYGEWQVTGEPRIDNIFRAVLIVDAQSRAIEERTAEAIDRLAETFGVELNPNDPLDDSAALVAAAVESALGEHVDWARWGAGPCVADFALAQEAQAQCEAHRGCDVSTDLVPGPVDCEGACLGSCEGDCSGECLTPIADEICAGTCYGACDTPMACDGDCYGDCSGECFAMNNHGCAGPCEGTCQGICETIRGASCGGTCTGLCGVTSTGECEGECRGACDGNCTGDCVGQAFAWTGGSEAECDATADCSGASRLLSWAAPSATWIDHAVYWSPATDDDSVAVAELAYQFTALEDEMRALIAANAELEALVTGDDGYEVESPVSAFGETIQGLAADGPDALDLPAGTEECLADALGAAVEILSDVANRATSTLPAQIELLAVIAAD
jgi:hypothetical protein